MRAFVSSMRACVAFVASSIRAFVSSMRAFMTFAASSMRAFVSFFASSMRAFVSCFASSMRAFSRASMRAISARIHTNSAIISTARLTAVAMSIVEETPSRRCESRDARRARKAGKRRNGRRAAVRAAPTYRIYAGRRRPSMRRFGYLARSVRRRSASGTSGGSVPARYSASQAGPRDAKAASTSS